MVGKSSITNAAGIMITALFIFWFVMVHPADTAFAQQETAPGQPSPTGQPAAPPIPFTGQPVPGQAPQPSVAPGTAPAPAAPGSPSMPQAPSTPAVPTPAAPGQPAVPAAPQAPAAPHMPAQPATPGQSRAVPSAGGSSFFFDDADVFEVVQTVFGEVLRVNYIIDPSVKGRVNFRTITPIPRDKILSIMEIILRLNGIAVIEESGLYRIIPIGGISKEPAPIRFGKSPEAVDLKGVALLQVVPLTYINSVEMAAILTPLLTQGGAIHDIPKKNIIIIADTDANVKRLLQVVAMFDVDTYKDANQPKVYVYALQNSKAEHTAKILQQVLLGASVGSTASATSTVKTTTGGGASSPSIPQPGPTAPQTVKPAGAAGETLVAPNTKIIADEVANSLVIFASPADYAIVLGAIKQIDTIPRQVMIEVIVADLDLKDGLTLGLRWNLGLNAHKLKISPFSKPITVGGPLGFQGLSALGAGTFGYTAVDSGGNVRLAIEADATASKAKILSAPSILVADNREARIQVGKQVPLATSTTTTPGTTLSTGGTISTANTTTSTVQYKDVGTILKVKPQINDSGLIALEMSQEISDAAPVDVLGTQQLEITKTEVTSNLVIQDGDTIVIGGLIQENDTNSNTGIPGINKIPIIKYLFGTNTISKERHETVILLTPRVVRSQAEAKNVTSDYYELFKNVSKEMTPGKYTAPNTHPNTEKSAPDAQQNNAKPSGKTAEPATGSITGDKSADYPSKSE